MGNCLAHAITQQIGGKVTVGRVDFGLLNRIIVDDIDIAGEDGEAILHAARAAAWVDVVGLMRGQVNITTAQLFGLRMSLWKSDPNAELNIQHIIDALSRDEDNSENSKLHIGVLLVRHGSVNYDVLSEEKKGEGLWDSNHLALKDVALTASLSTDKSDALVIGLKRLNFRETKSGLELRNLSTILTLTNEAASTDAINIQTASSTVQLGKTEILFAADSLTFHTKIIDADLLPSEFSAFASPLAYFSDHLQLQANIEGKGDKISITRFELADESKNLKTAATAQIQGNDFLVDIQEGKIGQATVAKLLASASVSDSLSGAISRLGDIALTGNVQKIADVYAADLSAITTAGNVDLNLNYAASAPYQLSCFVGTESIDVGRFFAQSSLGKAAFHLTMKGEAANFGAHNVGVEGDVAWLEYDGHTYEKISLDGLISSQLYRGRLTVDDSHLKLAFDGDLAFNDNKQFTADAELDVAHFEPRLFHLSQRFADDVWRFRATTKVRGNDLQTLEGTLQLDSIVVQTAEGTLRSGKAQIEAEILDHGNKQISISSDFLTASLYGNVQYNDIIPLFKQQIVAHLPSLMPYSSSIKSTDDTYLNFNVEAKETALISHLLASDITLGSALQASGFINAAQHKSILNVDIPSAEYDGRQYDDVSLRFSGNSDSCSATLRLLQRNSDAHGATRMNLLTSAKGDQLRSALTWRHSGQNPSSGTVSAIAHFAREAGLLRSNISLQPSQFQINDTAWTMTPATIAIVGRDVSIENLKIESGARYLKLGGKISDRATDILTLEMNNTSVEYVLGLVDFTAVNFRGRAFGKVYLSNIYDTPRCNAALRVDDFAIGEGILGVGNIRASIDENDNSIKIAGHIVDDTNPAAPRTTDCEGYVSPKDNYINLRITADNTDARFLNEFLGGIFRDISGRVDGQMNVVGPLNDIGLIGDMSPQIDMTLRPTGVRYHINPSDTIRLRPYSIQLRDIHLFDAEQNVGIANGEVTHRNVKNFAYTFQIALNNLLVYTEDLFNSDKFMGKVYADGRLSLRGADRNPLYINADIEPSAGSMFAYDAATPDAIASTSFINIRPASQPLTGDESAVSGQIHSSPLTWEEQGDVSSSADYEYHGDIVLNANIDITPRCLVKLRMDNVDDGYITTHGRGMLHAYYHNKGGFTLSGTYNISDGHYRLYLQDVIHRDLDIKDGSTVVFNGDPFDADIHLICQHTINSVPLTDLTRSNFNQSADKVKVNCLLDITGSLGNMNFNFGIDLPNVNDEIRQIVRSYISTDEEMNTQIIYLLTLGRFYTPELARQASGSSGSGTVNTLLSSTISGQVNQMLQGALGQNSKWNFGTGLSTGELGWTDLDVEGMLSGRLLDDRLLINGNFGYRDNQATQNPSFIGDFDIKWRLSRHGNTYLKAYNKTNDRYFTKATLNTQGVGISYSRDF